MPGKWMLRLRIPLTFLWWVTRSRGEPRAGRGGEGRGSWPARHALERMGGSCEARSPNIKMTQTPVSPRSVRLVAREESWCCSGKNHTDTRVLIFLPQWLGNIDTSSLPILVCAHTYFAWLKYFRLFQLHEQMFGFIIIISFEGYNSYTIYFSDSEKLVNLQRKYVNISSMWMNQSSYSAEWHYF